MAYSIGRRRRRRSGAGGSRPATISCLPGRHRIHHPLETAVRQLGQQPRAARRSPVAAGRQGRPDPASVAAEFSGRRRAAGGVPRLLPEKRRYSFEFRHPSWYAPRILRLLSERNIALCLSDHHDAPAPWRAPPISSICAAMARAAATRGTIAPPCSGEWARRIRSWKKQGCDVFVYSTTTRRAPRRPMRSSSVSCAGSIRRLQFGRGEPLIDLRGGLQLTRLALQRFALLAGGSFSASSRVVSES